jgi:hypothetical protein
MDRVATYVTNAIVTSTQLNTIQDRAAGGVPSTTGLLTGANSGERLLWWQSASDIANGAILTVDTASWKDFVVSWELFLAAGALQDIGAANDYVFDSGTQSRGVGYLGNGAQNSTGGQVTNGNPPVRAAGASWAADLGAGMWLYVDGFDSNTLKLYNGTGGSKRTPFLHVVGTKTNKR